MVEAVVEFDYEAQQDDELSLTVGDIILNIRRDDGGWWEGELDGRRGLFPDNFVREIKKEAKRDGGQASMIRPDLSNGRASPVSDPSTRSGKKVEQIRKRRCKAAFSYVPQHEDELELKIGDVIEIIAEVEEGWWEGFLNGKSGMFPSNFTKVIQTESETSSLNTSQEELRSSRTSKDSPGSESDGGDSRSETGSEIQPKKVRGFGFGDIFKDQPLRLRPRSIDVDSEVDKLNDAKAASVASETMKTEPDGKARGREQCKVLFPYEAQNEDELSLKEGEIINIITKECADAGWWKGEIGGRQGVFPDNFVKLLEVEKERPRKPPPPSAPGAKHTTGEEMKVGDIPKPSIPSIIPKKPLHPKTSTSSSSQPPRRPERPPALACESPKSEGGASTPDSAPRDNDVDLDAVVPSTEKLSHPTATRPRVIDRRPRSQIITSSSLSGIDLDSPAVEDRKDRGKVEPESVSSRSAEVSLRKGASAIPVPDSKAPLPAKPSVLTPPSASHRPTSLSSSLGLSPSPELRHSPLTPLTLEELRNQLRDLRASVELLKSQHRQEMKQLTNALDEEKKIRLSLQMEVEHIRKSLSK
ncbi:SH3 domain-containing kinase-binding protein 1 isoform X3 [Sander lucioperca]|uniref:SH3 domain-containing kinase-binding protein 1 isoform X3 n=1 Tax=Sander lucioperca TaxID=283035 RepID=UPI00125D3F44|nr:SH3 domain-containing kinase-binding protein 1 isoform X3 [Sander lucioperca]